jgi:hypothetical protein
MKLKIHPILIKVQSSSIISTITRKGFRTKLTYTNRLIIHSR